MTKTRGRPRKFDYESLDHIGENLGPKTRRGQQNHEYAGRFYGMLKTAVGEDPTRMAKYQSLLDKPRPTVLAELGRLMESRDVDDVDFWLVVTIAANSAHEPAKKLVSFIRAWRLPDPGPEERRLRLRETLLRTLDAFLMRYPQTDLDDILEATGKVENSYIIRMRKEGSILPPEDSGTASESSANFAERELCEVRLLGILGSWPWIFCFVTFAVTLGRR